MSTAVSALRKYVMSEAPGCPVLLVDRAIVKSARDLCDKAKCWKDAVKTANMTSGTSLITLDVLACADVVAVEYLTFNGEELCPTTERELSLYDLEWRTTTGDPTHYFTVMRDTQVRVYPTPNRTLASAFKYEVIIKPKLGEGELEDFLVSQFNDALQHGALYELLRMNSRPWSNPQLAEHYRRRFREGIYEARDKAVRMYASQNFNIIPEPLF